MMQKWPVAKSLSNSINFHCLCILFSLAALCSCQAYSTPRSHIVAISNADFKNIELNSDTQNLCSPDVSIKSDFIGVAINVPTDVEFDEAEPAEDGSFTVIPICGYYQLSLVELSKNSVIQLFAMNVETEQVYRGELIEEDAGTEEPMPFDEPELLPQDLEGQLLSAYFNPNLTHYVDLPVEEATYKILVQIGQVKSNIVELKVHRK
tara:strand:- start:142 stop:762 length:621 start_codon:yes stop_codon:yes gene_type:complete